MMFYPFVFLLSLIYRQKGEEDPIWGDGTGHFTVRCKTLTAFFTVVFVTWYRER